MVAALGQAMLYVDGMNGVISHIGTIQWLYTLCAAKVSRVKPTHQQQPQYFSVVQISEI